MTGVRDDQGTEDEAIANGWRLLRNDPAGAEQQARIVIDGDPRNPDAHAILGLSLRARGEISEAQAAEQRAIALSSLIPEVFEASIDLAENRLDAAERTIRAYLAAHPNDAAALRVLAEVAARTGNFDPAEQMLARALAVAPDYEAAKRLRSTLSVFRKRLTERVDDRRGAVAIDSAEHSSDVSLATNYQDALDLYSAALREYPDHPQNWVSYGHVLRTVGRQDEAIGAYRRAIAIKPTFGNAWWALADLKSGALTGQDIPVMEALLATPELEAIDATTLHFSLGKAYEQDGRTDDAFRHYAAGNALRAAETPFDRTAVTRHVDRSIALFNKAFFADREDKGFPANDPIFILGLPRAGSTLIEQILASHSQVEGTMELPDIPGIANSLAGQRDAGMSDSPYLEQFAAAGGADLRRLGQSYIWSTGLRRITSKPYFCDKMPNNWLHIGLILAILPNAKIIDARREPLDCCISNFRQFFASGQPFTNSLEDLGSFYRDYVRLMDHVDRVVPGRVHRVIHEHLVRDPDAQIRALLDHIGLPFEQSCLDFHANRRAVRTSSSEQVRRPISDRGIGQAQPFAPYLDGLRARLGDVIDDYPNPPAFR